MVPYTLTIPFATPVATIPASSPISVASGATAGVRLPLPGRATITTLRVVQVGGTRDGFRYALYNTIAACTPPGGTSDASRVPYPAVHQVGPTWVVPAGQAAYAAAEGFPEDGVSNLALDYENQDDDDGTPLGRTTTSRDRALYLQIIDAGAGGGGAKTFAVQVVVQDPAIY